MAQLENQKVPLQRAREIAKDCEVPRVLPGTSIVTIQDPKIQRCEIVFWDPEGTGLEGGAIE